MKTADPDTVLLKDLRSSCVEEFSKSCNDPAWLTPLRVQAFKNFEAQPWPHAKDEQWKRINFKKLEWDKLEFQCTTGDDKNSAWIPLAEALKTHEKDIQNAWTQAVQRAEKNKFLSLNLALGNGGACLFVPKNKKMTVPFRQNLSLGQSRSAQFPIYFIFADEGSEAQIWEELKNPDSQKDAPAFVSSYLSVQVKDNAHASFYWLQHWNENTFHFQFQDITQGAHSRLNTVAVAVGGQVFRNESHIHLEGPGAENKVSGVLFGDGQQNFENWITQNHVAPQTTSDIQYRAALNGQAQSFFSGMVSIIKEAQKSDAFQSSKSLVLSKNAKAEAIPNLEILADDVKCAHGAAVGPVDEDQKYYLQTRGVPPKMAEEIIIQGFLEPVIAAIPSESVQNELRRFMEAKIGQ